MTAWVTSSAAQIRRHLLVGATVAAFAGAATVATLWIRPPNAPWARSIDGAEFHGREVTGADWHGAFSLLDPSGRRRTIADYRGKVLLLTFGYTRCPDACPTTLARLAQVRQLLGQDAEKVQVVFVTIDPERDNSAMLGSYVREFDSTFDALRGSVVETDAAVRSFHADYRILQHGREVLVEHTVDTYIVDPQGAVRVVLPNAESAQDAAQDVHLVLRDAGLCWPWSRVESARPDAAMSRG